LIPDPNSVSLPDSRHRFGIEDASDLLFAEEFFLAQELDNPFSRFHGFRGEFRGFLVSEQRIQGSFRYLNS